MLIMGIIIAMLELTLLACMLLGEIEMEKRDPETYSHIRWSYMNIAKRVSNFFGRIYKYFGGK